jgi:hypothetical protein
MESNSDLLVEKLCPFLQAMRALSRWAYKSGEFAPKERTLAAVLLDLFVAPRVRNEPSCPGLARGGGELGFVEGNGDLNLPASDF